MSISLATFATSNWKQSPIRILQQLELIQRQVPMFNKVMLFNETTLPQGFFDRFKDHLSDHAFALFAWKPCVLLEALSKVNNGDFLMYIDGGSSLPFMNALKFNETVEFLKSKISTSEINFGVGHFYNYGDKENIRIVRKKILEKFDLLEDVKFLHDYPHFEAGALIIQKTDASINFIQKWYKFICDNYESSIKSGFLDRDGEYPEFIHNGSDQAVLQCMLYKEDTKFYSVGTFFYDFGINTRLRG